MSEARDDVFRVSVYYDRKSDRDNVVALLNSVKPERCHEYAHQVDGWATKEVVEQLKGNGFRVYRRRAAPPAEQSDATSDTPELPGAERRRRATRRLVSNQRERLEREVESGQVTYFNKQQASEGALLGGGPPADESAVYEVALTGPTREGWLERLKQIAGADPLSYTPPDAYRYALTTGQAEKVGALTFIRSVRVYDVADTLGNSLFGRLTGKSEEAAEQEDDGGDITVAVEASPGYHAEAGGDLSALVASPEPEPQAADGASESFFAAAPAPIEAPPEPEFLTLDLKLHHKRYRDEVIGALKDAGLEILEAAGYGVRVRVPNDPTVAAAIAAMWQIQFVDTRKQAKLFVDHARSIIGLTSVNAAASAAGGSAWTGRGVTVCMFDSGVDRGHPGLKHVTVEVVPGATENDQAGHGTHVAGIIAGTGARSGGAIPGVAPEAKLVSIHIVAQNGSLLLPPDLATLLKLAIPYLPKIINLSWGFNYRGSYEEGALDVDRFAYEHPDILIVAAAGNWGTAKKGRSDYGSLALPANAKNVLAVGASTTDRTAFQRTWRQFDPKAFPQPPTSDLCMTGVPIVAAALSSRGPTDFDSIKPDLLAPGTYILSSRAGGVNAPPYWALDNDPLYAYWGGTSMAAPVASGAAAVLCEYLATKFKERDAEGIERPLDPSAALLKALLIAASVPLALNLSPQVVAAVGSPDFDQGFGLLDLSTMLPTDACKDRRIAVVDVRNSDARALQSRAPEDSPRRPSRTYRLRVTGSEDPLRVVLTWTDPAGRGVQNNLQLEVIDPNGASIPGNVDHVFKRVPAFDESNLDGLPFDKLNTVERVVIRAPQKNGDYTVVVSAQNTSQPPQGFALCACGQIDGLLTEVGV